MVTLKEEISHLYRIANVLPRFLEVRGFTPESAGGVKLSQSELMDDAVPVAMSKCS